MGVLHRGCDRPGVGGRGRLWKLGLGCVPETLDRKAVLDIVENCSLVKATNGLNAHDSGPRTWMRTQQKYLVKWKAQRPPLRGSSAGASFKGFGSVDTLLMVALLLFSHAIFIV